MVLNDDAMKQAQETVETAFPNVFDWEWNNADDDMYIGFTLWGELEYEEPENMANFFVTFNAVNEGWQGHLTVGKPSYYWSSANFGDAHLLSTQLCQTLEAAIQALKNAIRQLAAALTVAPSQ